MPRRTSARRRRGSPRTVHSQSSLRVASDPPLGAHRRLRSKKDCRARPRMGGVRRWPVAGRQGGCLLGQGFKVDLASGAAGSGWLSRSNRARAAGTKARRTIRPRSFNSAKGQFTPTRQSSVAAQRGRGSDGLRLLSCCWRTDERWVHHWATASSSPVADSGDVPGRAVSSAVTARVATASG